ncbi:hypothetical protein [Streptomyces mirabilis]|uniref:hypothetical protein n=1 Tax=Streptomyces mirabilis TaxID=68239 RepID=UPI00367C01FA
MADAYGASVNETCLAALAQAFRRWRRGNEHDGPACPDLPALVPMPTRLAQEQLAPGNRLVSHRLSLPCSAEELGEAVDRVRDQSQTVPASRMRDAARLALTPLTPRLGEWATSRMAVAQAAPVVASSVTYPGAMTCAGGRLIAASMFCDPYNERLAFLSFTPHDKRHSLCRGP